MEPKADESGAEPATPLPMGSSSMTNASAGGNADEELVRLAQSGQQSAFNELIKRYQRQAVAVSYRLLGNTHDALEVTQDAFLKAYTNLATLQKPGAFAGWLMRIVSNLSLNYRRGRKSRSSLPLSSLMGSDSDGESSGGDWVAPGADPLHTLESRELGVKLQEALKQLPEKQRLAIIMFTIQEMPQKDVAEALDCSVEAVKWHVFQGRKRLKEMLKDQLS
jgi:RNA polymerase sigma-70 factor (ECF subfamily)